MKFPSVSPAVVGTIVTPAGLRLLRRADGPADVAEVRVDALLAAEMDLEAIDKGLRGRKIPVLLTLRIPPEGGHMRWDAKYRRETFLRLLPHVEAVDVELATVKAIKIVLDTARSTKRTIVLSAHALKKPATPSQFAAWARQSRAYPGAILKIAGQVFTRGDLQRLAAVIIDAPDFPVAVMGLGPNAGQSRSILATLGSRLVYGYLDSPAAPGQPSAAEVRKMVKDVTLPD